MSETLLWDGLTKFERRASYLAVAVCASTTPKSYKRYGRGASLTNTTRLQCLDSWSSRLQFYANRPRQELGLEWRRRAAVVNGLH